MKTKKAVNTNLKTIKSFDLTTICLKNCPYCYIQYHRVKGDFFAVDLCKECIYNHDILRLKQTTIDKLNAIGGLRCFSNADYQERFYQTMKTMLDDCLTVGLKVKVITKQESFLRDFYNHKAVNIINISVDSLGLKNAGFSMKEALKLKKQYGKKVKIRSVILSESDFNMFADSDIITFNHGKNGFHNFTSKERIEISKQYKIEKKTCCLSGKCITCKVKCGSK